MIIDIHAHIGRIVPDQREFMDAPAVVAKMDAWGIDKACVLALSDTPEGSYLEAGTEDVLRECARFPDRLIPFCLIDPRFGDNSPTMDFSGLLAEYKARGCRGLGEVLPKMPFDDPKLLNLYRHAGKAGLPVLFDMYARPDSYGVTDEPGLPRLERALAACPETTFIGHGPTFWAEISGGVTGEDRWAYPKGKIQAGGAVPRLLGQYANLVADISALSGYNALARDQAFGLTFLEQFQDKLLFGCDNCLRSNTLAQVPIMDYFLAVRDAVRIPQEAWDKIAWKNAKRVLAL